jgi:hypothetical protein
VSKADDIRATILAMPGATEEEVLGALVKAGHPKARAAAFIRLLRGGNSPSPAPEGRAGGRGGSRTPGGATVAPNHAPNKSYGPPAGVYVPTGQGRKRRDFNIGRRRSETVSGQSVHPVSLGAKSVDVMFTRVNGIANWTIGDCSEADYKEFADELAKYDEAELYKMLAKLDGTSRAG